MRYVLQGSCLLGRMGFGEGDVKGTSLLDKLLEWLPMASEFPGRLKEKSSQRTGKIESQEGGANGCKASLQMERSSLKLGKGAEIHCKGERAVANRKLEDLDAPHLARTEKERLLCSL